MGETKEKLQIQVLNEEEGNEGENGKNVIGERKNEKCNECDNGKIMWSEKERRKKIGSLFATLHDLLPHLPSKANKSTIVDETISYIESLKQTLEKLEKEKKERLQSLFTFGVHPSIINSSQWYPNDSTNANANGNSNTSTSIIPSTPTKLVAFETWSSPNLVLNICGNEAQFCILATRKQNILTTIALVLEKHQIDVISASILSNGHGNQYTILAHVSFELYPLNHFIL
ncbi:hypothetical protein TanjilG_13864 [Lupinus angustifolius]|uniref:BHLH domain-containing protein n=1 Tax=Lupinus angustifolius TaxID=3871 RepID=A0A1J7GHK4_LUPAN|nr:hypothetical protein TanjilG_13864 [Lupinus angustifolius]